MNRTSIKFLINLFIILSFNHSIEFHEWANNIENLISNKNQISQISFKAIIKSNNVNLYDENDYCHLILDSSNDIYQIVFSNNIIYYDGIKMDHYNLNS